MSQLKKGDVLPELKKPAITQDQLQAYAEASLDDNPIHLNESIAKRAGLPGTIAHGMLSMAFMGEFLHQALAHLGWQSGTVASMSCRFKAMTFPGDSLVVQGVVREASDSTLSCDLKTLNQKGEVTCTGFAELCKKA